MNINFVRAAVRPSSRLIFLALAQIAVVLLNVVGVESAPAGAIAILGGTLIDGSGGAPRPDVTVIIRGERIAQIGAKAEIAVPADALVINAEGKYILPGFIDAHIHYRDFYPELLITHGITSVADWGGSPREWILAQREGISKGKIYGPRIYTCGEALAEGNDSADMETALRRVRELVARGVDKIDIGFSIRPEVIKAVIEEAHRSGLPVSGYPVHAREAIEWGIDAIKHTYVLGSANTTDPQRLKEIYRQATIPDSRGRDPRLFLLGDDHDDLVRLMAAKGVAWIPTLVKDFKVIHDRRDEFEKESLRLLSNPELQYLPENYFPQLTNDFETGIPVVASGRIGTVDRNSADYRIYRQAYRNLQSFIRKLVKAGGRVLAGTAPHSFVLPGLALHQEMQLLVDAGLTPMQALQSATLWVAEYLRAEKDIGSVAEGKLADIVILKKNPLEDIRNTRTVETVIQGGRVLPTGYHRSYSNPIPRNTTRNAPGAGNPVPKLESISPLVATEGSGDLTLTVSGKAFVPGAVVFFEKVPLETEFVSATELKAIIPERLLRTVGTYWLYVSNPRPGGGDSEPASLIVKYR